MQFIFSKKNDSRKQQILLKTTAYTDFLKAVAGVSITQRSRDTVKELEYKTLLIDAKSRIAVYGSDLVIKKLADFYRIGPILDNSESCRAFILLVSEMRKENKRCDKTELNDISQLLLSKDIE